ncbi:MAG: anti-anti-sigma factor, partial [Gammaproteobacteria bacterium]|nr:anti-anti-sigma factor [Gammaproteobacteria bacterium]
FEDVFHIVERPLLREEQLGELPETSASEEDLRRRVLEAHQTLMGLNESNREAFKDLVSTLEAAAPKH